MGPRVIPVIGTNVSAVKAIVSWGLWGPEEEAAEHNFVYDYTRPLTLTEKMPWKGDCSWWVKWCFWRAGCLVDPTGAGWGHWGNSSSIYARSQHVPASKVRPADIVTYGPGGDDHAALVVSVTGSLIMCSSMGEQGQPVRVTNDELKGIGEPTYCRVNTAARHPVYAP